jgi:DNA polymerase-3 subunit delta'
MSAGAVYLWQHDAWQLAHAAIARGAHALLVAGPRGSGKRDFALALAAAYLCADRAADGSACGRCESCRWIAAGTHPDHALIEPLEDEEGEEGTAKRAKPITVDQVRQLSALLALTSHRPAGKAIVLHPAEALNPAASNALLKSLEEPPTGALFILVANRPALLLATVRSRCQLVPIRIGDTQAIRTWLAANAERDDAELLLALAGGAPLEAAAIGRDPQWARRAAFLSALALETADPIALAETYRDVAPALILSWLQTWTFDLTHVRYCGRCRYHRDLETLAARVAETTDPIAVTRLHRRLVAAQRHINHPLHPRLLVEQWLIAYCDVAIPAGALS